MGRAAASPAFTAAAIQPTLRAFMPKAQIRASLSTIGAGGIRVVGAGVGTATAAFVQSRHRQHGYSWTLGDNHPLSLTGIPTPSSS